MDYVSLHTHSTYSYGDGYGTVDQHVKRVARLKMSALALTEHGNVSSWVALEQACKRTEDTKQPVKPIFGLEAYTGRKNEMRKTHMILLAMNEVGLQSLNRIVSQSWRDFYKFPTVHFPVVSENHQGLIVLSGCADSHLSCTLLGGKYHGEKREAVNDKSFRKARVYVEKMQEIFQDRFYLEVQRFPGLPRTCALNPALEKLWTITGAPLVATCDVHYPNPNDNEMQRILHASHRGQSVEAADASWEYDIKLTYPLSDAEITNDLVGTGLSTGAAESAIYNTGVIAGRCNVELPKAESPKYVVGEKDWESWT